MVLSLVLALGRNNLEIGNSGRLNGGIADKLKEVTRITAQISPSKDNLASVTLIDAEADALIEQEGLLVLIGVGATSSALLVLVFSLEIFLALLVDTLDDELILKLLAGAADGAVCVGEDELAVAFGRVGADEVELALGDFDDGFLGGGVAEEVFASCWR